MSEARRVLDRAIRLTPRRERARFQPEWEQDYADAATAGVDEMEVARAALRLAWRRRARQLGEIVTGGYGVPAAVGAFLVVAAVLGLAWLLGGFALILAIGVLAVAVVSAVMAGVPTNWTHWALIGSALVFAVSFGYVWWVAGVTIDADDTRTPVPAAAQYGGAGIIVCGVGVAGIIVSALVAVRHARTLRP